MAEEKTARRVFRWVERSEKLIPFGEYFDTAEEAIRWGKEWVSGGNMTPEHAQIFLITLTDSERGVEMDIYRETPDDAVTTLGWLL